VLPQAFSILAAAIAGAVGGWLFHRLWRALLPAGRSRAFWTSLPQTVRGMVTTEEPAEVLRHYKQLITTTARYTARSLGAVLVAILPSSAIFLLLSALDPSDRMTALVEVHRTDGERVVLDRRALDDSAVRLGGVALDEKSLAHKHGWCGSMTACLLFEAMMFDTHAIGEQGGDVGASAWIARPFLFDRNPFWPYLNDLESSFFVAVMLGGFGAAWWQRNRRPRTT
jgi:hypothetical protein